MTPSADPDREPIVQNVPLWPTTPPAHGSILLREITDDDLQMAIELGEDPYIPLIGTLPAHPTNDQALEWIQRGRDGYVQGIRMSFVIADAQSDEAVGTIGFRLGQLSEGRASAGYAVSPRHRGRGIATSALKALTTYAWTLPDLHRIELYIEPWNQGSIRVAERCGYLREGLLRSHQEIGGTRRDMLLYAATRS
jgi:[ribosomal protein S5]-alanine N-acetyltransferase